jgi:hypothetical protein
MELVVPEVHNIKEAKYLRKKLKKHLLDIENYIIDCQRKEQFPKYLKDDWKINLKDLILFDKTRINILEKDKLRKKIYKLKKELKKVDDDEDIILLRRRIKRTKLKLENMNKLDKNIEKYIEDVDKKIYNDFFEWFCQTCDYNMFAIQLTEYEDNTEGIMSGYMDGGQFWLEFNHDSWGSSWENGGCKNVKSISERYEKGYTIKKIIDKFANGNTSKSFINDIIEYFHIYNEKTFFNFTNYGPPFAISKRGY